MIPITRTKMPYNSSLINYNFRNEDIYFYIGMEDKSTLQQKTPQKNTNLNQ